MADRTTWEKLKVDGTQVLDRLKRILAEGNARRIVVKQKGKNVAEFPLTLGVVGALLAPVLSAVAAFVALLSDCSIEVERAVPEKETRAKRPRR